MIPKEAGSPARATRVRRIRRGLSIARGYFPLTNLGLSVAAAALLSYLEFAAPRIDYVLQVIGLLAMALVLIALVVVLPGTLWLRRAATRAMDAQDRAPIYFEARRGFAEGLCLPVLRWFPLLEISWTWEDAPGIRMQVESGPRGRVERIESDDRIMLETIRRRFVVEDAFGLARIVFFREQAREVRILPWPGQLHAAPMFRSHASGEEVPYPMGEAVGDRVDMRRYVPGDPLRLMLWKVFARTGELMVRTPERAISPSLKIAAYLPAALADEPAAAAARVAIESGYLGEDWRFSADGAAKSAEQDQEATGLVIDSARARGTELGDAFGLGAFLESVGDASKCRLVLFVPARPGPWLERTQASLARWSGPVTAVIVTDGLDSEPDDGRQLASWRTRLVHWLKRPGATSAELSAHRCASEELAAVVRGFAHAGADVVALDRPSGRTLPVKLGPSRRAA